MDETNPDEDIVWEQKSGPRIYVAGEVAKCYTAVGKYVSSIRTDRLMDLWRRFHNAKHRGLHDRLDPAVGTFEREILLLLERYPVNKREKD